MNSYPIFTINNFGAAAGAHVKRPEILGETCPTIEIGQEGRGRGRKLGRIAVFDIPEDATKVVAAAIAVTDDGYTLVAAPPTHSDRAIVVIRCGSSYRGHAWVTGDGPEAEFPGTILVEGRCADGCAGRAGSGHEIIALIDENQWFCVRADGRPPSLMFHRLRRGKIESATKAEREFAESRRRFSSAQVRWL